MSHNDLDSARAQYHALRGLIIHHPGGWRDEIALRRIEHICRSAAEATRDRECRQHIGAIEDYSQELYSVAGHLKWARGHTSGADYLRLQILRELDAFNARLSAIEAARDASAWQRMEPDGDDVRK